MNNRHVMSRGLSEEQQPTRLASATAGTQIAGRCRVEGAWTATGRDSSASAGPSLAKGGMRVAATVARETVAVGDAAAAAAAADTAVKRGLFLALAAAFPPSALSTCIPVLKLDEQ